MRIIVTPAGRRKTLELLYLHLKKNKDEFDKWILWLNTENRDDIKFIYKLSTEENWIDIQSCQHPFKPVHIGYRIYKFILTLNNVNDLYIRIDDDVCYMEKNAIDKLFIAREKNKDSLLVYPTILNNYNIQYQQQQFGILNVLPKFKDYSMNGDFHKTSSEELNLWQSGQLAEKIHRLFFDKFYKNELNYFYIPDYMDHKYKRISVNVIAMRGDLNHLIIDDDMEEEEYLSSVKPKEIKIPNEIIGNSLFCHYSYYPQFEYLSNTNVLEEYRKILNADRPSK